MNASLKLLLASAASATLYWATKDKLGQDKAGAAAVVTGVALGATVAWFEPAPRPASR
jgi:hypothetical protein